MDFHLIPGYFASGSPRLLERLVAGTGALRLRGLVAVDPGGPPHSAPADEIASWLAAAPQGSGRRARADVRVLGQATVPLEIESFGASAGRVLLGLSLETPEEGTLTSKDVEMALLGLACTALANESQGAVLIGTGLGPVGAGAGGGTVKEQVRRLAEIQQDALAIVIVPPDTAASIGELPGFAARDLAGFREYRRP